MGDLLELRRRYSKLEQANDIAGIARFLAAHPAMVTDRESASMMLYWAARAGDVKLIRLLLDRGVDVNVVESMNSPSRALVSAVNSGSAEAVRLLIGRGSDVNWRWDDDPAFCPAIAPAIMDGRADIVKLLVEAGADLSALDRTNNTPLAWAVAYGREEIARYLRGKGAVMSRDAPGYREPEPVDPLLAHVEGAVGPVSAVEAEDGGVSLWVAGTEDGGWLFTKGMSDVPLADGAAAEIAVCAPFGAGHPDDLLEPGLAWLGRWLRRLARLPREGTWPAGRPVAVFAEEPPAPLSEHTAMTGWLLLEGKHPWEAAELPGGRRVEFFVAVPIHAAERDFVRRHGWQALLARFEEAGVSETLESDRPSVV